MYSGSSRLAANCTSVALLLELEICCLMHDGHKMQTTLDIDRMYLNALKESQVASDLLAEFAGR